MRNSTPVHVYDVKKETSLLSFCMHSFIHDIFPINIWASDEIYQQCMQKLVQWDMEKSFFVHDDFSFSIMAFELDSHSYKKH